MNEQSLIVRFITNKMFPFIFMYGIHVIMHGSSTPGGGFQGGIIIAAGYILITIVDTGNGRNHAPDIVIKIMMSCGALMFVCIGMLGIFFGYSFMSNRVAGILPQGIPGSLFSGGTLVGINIAIGINVACGIIILFFTFLDCNSNKKIQN